jgi:Ni,Fe-hydrogenase I cytochrome b subunit
LSPRFVYIIISFVLYTFCFLYGIWNRDYFVRTLSEKYPFLHRNSIVFSVILCFSNFIIYFFITSIRYEISVSRFKKTLNKEKLEDLVRNYTELEKDAQREMEENPLQKVSEISITEKKQNGSPENNNKE